ncbi:R3H and coiled-coil domain-containing protein 1-like isoform X1 [Varroa destructor]|uniref:R3H domain-containing protein n=1 Tax=Varroa destructor TaxID=109461 RepID=A0A7M7K575_VARDE|nr:R3H and coiled-coil domain-containing protein 1-like isoform X1 [Varroa destructor]XP_022661817.1 R3H and coiled-coil domain-containing protein 1-like isoform X1 [Varroa destructor]XP_022661818.1 R3H and coiled-coil domain-containing protein 1-like isoform X1 [Varroa destructor]XP_022661819.1 R3H and coiled-coil domain-containing protein 1-like isoform X1 [Varroa destructor]XP_022661820.1 R3H and coiled-coil domain-containing protein 1-like isoform X1 [Varroa destructor]
MPKSSSLSKTSDSSLTLGGRYLTVEERALLYQVDCDVTSFVSKKAKLTSISDTRLCETAESNNPCEDEVLLLPSLSPRRRFLVHSLIQKQYWRLVTFSIGEGNSRATVICFRETLIRAIQNGQCQHAKVLENFSDLTCLTKKPTGNHEIVQFPEQNECRSIALKDSSPETRSKLTTKEAGNGNGGARREFPQKQLYVPPKARMKTKRTHCEHKPTIDENTVSCEMAEAKDNYGNIQKELEDHVTLTDDLTCDGDVALPAEEDSWETKFNDAGEPTCPEAMRELELALGKVKVSRPKIINYLEFTPADADKRRFDDVKDGAEMGHVLELYGFPAEFRTRELVAFLKGVGGSPEIRWVDDEHALAVFSTTAAARNALNQTKDGIIKRRSLNEASESSKAKAREAGLELPHKPRPKTSSLIAKRLVSGALGIPVSMSREEREKEKLLHKEARERRRQAKQQEQQKKDTWDDD